MFPSSCFRCGPVRDSNRMIEKEGRHIWVINQFKVLKSAGFTPDLLPSTPSSSNGAKATPLSNAPPETPSKKRPAQNDDDTTNGGTPLSSSNSFGASSSASSAKRSLFDGAMAQPVRSSSTPSASSAPQFIAERATHKISDLNPYQNKYTIRARCVHRGELAERSTSRWQGHVFSVVLQDKSGDIRATGFSEFARKFHPMFKEGAVYYVSHAQVRLELTHVSISSKTQNCFLFRKVKPIHNRKFNTTSHNYELGFNQNTVVVECKRSSADIPSVLYTFVKIAEVVESKQEGDTIDLIGICTAVEEVKEVRYLNLNF